MLIVSIIPEQKATVPPLPAGLPPRLRGPAVLPPRAGSWS